MKDIFLIKDSFEKIISNQYEFNSDKYSELLETLIFIDCINNPIECLEFMSKSDDYSVIFALSYILEHTSRDFMKENQNKIADIIIKAIKKGYDRANFYFSESLLYVMDRDIDYISYIDLLIESDSIPVQDIALTHLFRLELKDLIIFEKLSQNLNFSYMLEGFDDFKSYLSINDKSGVSITQKKIVAMSYYKKYNSKRDTYNLFGEKNQYIFDFIYFLP